MSIKSLVAWLRRTFMNETTAQRLTRDKNRTDTAYDVAQRRAEQSHIRGTRDVQAVALAELRGIEHSIAHAAKRAQALLDTTTLPTELHEHATLVTDHVSKAPLA